MRPRKIRSRYLVHPIRCADGWCFLEVPSNYMPQIAGGHVELPWHRITERPEFVSSAPYVRSNGAAYWQFLDCTTHRGRDEVMDLIRAQESVWLFQYISKKREPRTQSNPSCEELNVTWL